MADIDITQRITESIGQAKSTVDKFGPLEQLTGTGAERLPSRRGADNTYAQDLNEIIEGKFLELTTTIRNMRSSFLPYTYYTEIDNMGNNSAMASDLKENLSGMESYENAFMRMLGMPSVTTQKYSPDDSSTIITQSQNLYILKKDEGL